MIRVAVIDNERGSITLDQVRAYMPSNYQAFQAQYEGEILCNRIVINGFDNAGWTLDDYVIPRLASGMIFARELK